jgi:hypothetical protein
MSAGRLKSEIASQFRRAIVDNQGLVKKILEIKELADECLAALASKESEAKKQRQTTTRAQSNPARLDFNMPLRPFIKKYAKGMSGPKKFTLLLARLAQADLKTELSLGQIETDWNKMTSAQLLGMKFNRFYSVQAKDNDWVESKRKGFYNLRPGWQRILSR